MKYRSIELSGNNQRLITYQSDPAEAEILCQLVIFGFYVVVPCLGYLP